jgi:hypothetical protein
MATSSPERQPVDSSALLALFWVIWRDEILDEQSSIMCSSDKALFNLGDANIHVIVPADVDESILRFQPTPELGT